MLCVNARHVVVYKHMVKMGRPKKSKKEKKSVRLQVVVDEAMADELSAEAQAIGLELSPYLRMIILGRPRRPSR